MKRSRLLSRIHVVRLLGCALLAALFIGRDSAAHHVPGHNQNPSPPPPLTTTEIVTFEAGSLIIPMDGCYSRMSFLGNTDLNQIISPNTIASAKCNSTSEKDDGVIPAYSLIMRLVNAGVPVSWAIRGGKTSWQDIDFTIIKPTGNPAYYRLPGGSTVTNRYTALTAINYRGAPWVIKKADVSNALTLIDSYAAAHPEYLQVDMHIAQADFTAPIFRTVESIPKLAVINVDDPTTDLQNPQTAFITSSITDAVMTDLQGVLWDWVTIDEVLAGSLTSGGYKVAWIPSFDLKANTPLTSRQQQFFDGLSAFADAGGHLLFEDGSVAALEGWGSMSGMTYNETAVTAKNYQTAGAGLIPNGTSGTWDNGNDAEHTLGQDYSDPSAQFGGMPWTGIGGSKYNWKPRYDYAYQAGVRRMVYSDKTGVSAADNWDFATWRRKDNDPGKGVIFYLGGYNWRKNTSSGFRILLNTLFFDASEPATYTTVEISRSSPIIAPVDGVESHLQGSYELLKPDDPDDPAATPTTFTGAASADRFSFPFYRGHLRAFAVADVTATGTDFEDIPAIFDAGAANMIPPADVNGCGTWFTTGCRTVFTHATSPDASGLVVAPTRVYLSSPNVSLLKPWLGSEFSDSETETLISRILAGIDDGSGNYSARLGGIDRSTLAHIEPSPLVPAPGYGTRPTMMYVGALDGMLHALCAEVRGPCTQVGMELWAYVPRSQLAALKFNTARIDGSPRVADVFDDFDGDQRKEWRTILTLQTASGTAAFGTLQPGVVALDISDPADPKILWARSPPDVPGVVDFGTGLNTAMAPARVAGAQRNLTLVETNNGGTGGPGIYLGAYDTANGSLVWEFEHEYPAPRDLANPEVPGSGIPGGVSVFDMDGGSMATHVAVPTLYGDLWILQADGTNPYSSGPALRFSTDFHPVGAPPVIYADQNSGRMHVAVVTGGYADPTVATWSLLTETQYAVSIVADPNVGNAPIDEAGTTFGTDRAFVADLGTNRAFAQAVVSGNELFVITDETDVNLATYGTTGTSTGQLRRYSLTGGAQKGSAIVIAGGAASADVSTPGGVVHIGSPSTAQKIDVETTGGGGAWESQGVSLEKNSDEATERLLWLSS